MLRLASSWVWDSWIVDDGDRFHLFFLKASRALHDQHRRHGRAAIGHAVSDDLVTWTEVADALVADDPPRFDDVATWTGSIVRDPAGLWRMFYTGVDRAGAGLVQRIGQATSSDLLTWERTDLVLQADDRWYERMVDGSGWPDEAWRDPWVMPDARTGGWRMLVTARAREGDLHHRGVVGHATSTDLVHWEIGPPLSAPSAGFGQLEVMQYAVVDGQPLLLFSCLHTEMALERREPGGGVWAVPVEADFASVDLALARRVTTEALYVGRLVRDRGGAWVMLAFHHLDEDGEFVGEIIDPVPVAWQGGRLVMTGDVPEAWRPRD